MTLALTFDESHVPEVITCTRRVLARFTAFGTPRPKGNMRPFLQHGRPAMHEATKGIGKWLKQLRGAARPAMGLASLASMLPICVELDLRVLRPLGHFKGRRRGNELSAIGRRNPWPIKRTGGDIDKLERAVLDALSSTPGAPAIAFVDDSQVVEVHKLKRWGESAGASIIVSEILDG